MTLWYHPRMKRLKRLSVTAALACFLSAGTLNADVCSDGGFWTIFWVLWVPIPQWNPVTCTTQGGGSNDNGCTVDGTCATGILGIVN